MKVALTSRESIPPDKGMEMHTKFFAIACMLLVTIVLQGCNHPVHAYRDNKGQQVA